MLQQLFTRHAAKLHMSDVDMYGNAVVDIVFQATVVVAKLPHVWYNMAAALVAKLDNSVAM